MAVKEFKLKHGETMAKKKKIYRAQSGAQYNQDMAQTLGEMLETIDNVTPDKLVEKSRPKRSPTHGIFEWDDSVAADICRRDQAMNAINHLHIVIKSNGSEETTRAYQNVVITLDDESERVYASMADVQKDPELAEQVIQRAKSELAGWRSRYRQYTKVFGDVFGAIDGLD